MKSMGTLIIGRYDGKRLAGGPEYPLAELTPEFVAEKVTNAMAEQMRRIFESELPPK